MDFLPILFLFVIVVASGGIALFADWLGRKLGKKRLTIGKLRPKTTAQLGTVLSGVIISSVTILLLFFASSDVRQWVREGRRAIAQRDDALRDLDSVRSEVQKQSERNQTLTRANRTAEAEVKAQQARLEVQRKEILEAQKEVTRIRRTVGDLQARIRGLNSANAKTLADLKTASDDLNRQKALLKKGREDFRMLQLTTRQAVDEFNSANTQALALSQANEKLQREVSTAGERVRQLQQESTNLTAAREDAERQLADAQNRLQEQQNRLVAGSIEVSNLEAERSRLQGAVRALGMIANATRTQPMTFSAGQEVARQTLAARATRDDALAAVRSLVRNARASAQARGAAPRGEFDVAGIFPRSDDAGRVTGTSDLETQLANQILSVREAQVLVAYSSLNAFVGEPVSLEIAVYRNPQIYANNAVVAETRVDGRLSDAEILKGLATFVQETVPERAVRDGLIPVRGSDQPVVLVDQQEMLQTLEEIRIQGRPVRVRATVSQETRASDPLRLLLRVG